MKNLFILSAIFVFSLSAFAAPSPVCGSVYSGDSANEIYFAVDYLADAPALNVHVITPKCKCSAASHAQIKFDLFKKFASYSDDLETIGHTEMKICVENANVDIEKGTLVIGSDSKIIIK